jgi:hypothetical protein
MRPSYYLVADHLLTRQKKLGVDVVGVSLSSLLGKRELLIFQPRHLSSCLLSNHPLLNFTAKRFLQRQVCRARGAAPSGAVLRPTTERYNYAATTSSPKLSDRLSEEEQELRKLYDQARVQGNKKKKKEYKEKIAELNRLRKSAQRESNRSKG